MTMQIYCRKSFVFLFKRERFHSCAPGRIDTLGGRTDGLGRPLRRSASTSRWKEWFTTASLPRVEVMASLFVIAGFGLLSCSLVAIAGKAIQKRATATTSSWASLIAEASQRFGVPAHWIRAVMQAESTGDTGALSPKGAMGLMQVMPETYAELRFRYDLGTDPYEPRNNILAGAAYLREMRDRFGPDGFLAAYNAGPARYDDYLKRGRALPEETCNYVATLAPVIGVPGLPHQYHGAPTVSKLTTSGAVHDGGEHLKAPSKSKLNFGISQFDGRQNAQSMTLFAIVRAVFEPASASAQTIDMTALAPPPSHTLIATSTAAESLRIRTSTASRSSLAPSSAALFAGRSTHTSK
jgi:hypothetical protein